MTDAPTQAKHKSQRSYTRLLGQTYDPATNAVSGVPIECRMAFPFHHEKRTKSAGGDKLDKPRNDCVVLVPKLARDAASCANYAILSAHCMEAATKAWPSAGGWPQGGKWPIQDGDVPHAQKPKPGVAPKTAEQTAKANAWRVGYWVIEVACGLETGPKVAVMQNGVPTEIPAKVLGGVALYKSGDYGYVSLNAYTFENKTFGTNFGYEGVLYTRPGEVIGSTGKSAQQMFAGVMPAAGAPPSGVYVPTAPAPAQAAPQQAYAPPTAPALPPAAPPPPPAAPGAAPVYAPPAAPPPPALPPLPR